MTTVEPIRIRTPRGPHAVRAYTSFRAYDIAIVALLACLCAVTVLSVALPRFAGAIHSGTLQIAMTTAALLIAVAASYFALGEFFLYGRASSLFVGLAFLVFVTSAGEMGLAPVLVGPGRYSENLPYGWALEQILGGILFVLAARRVERLEPIHRRLKLVALGLAGTIAFAACIATWVYLGPTSHSSDTVQSILQLVAALLFAAASALFWRATKLLNRTWFVWLSMSLSIASFAQIEYEAGPPKVGVVQPGDVLSLVFFTGILLALGGEWTHNYRRLRWQARELEALHSLMRAPAIQDVPALVAHITRVVEETLGYDVRLHLAPPRTADDALDMPMDEEAPLPPLHSDPDRVLVETGDGAAGRVALGVPLGSSDRQLGMLVVRGDDGAGFTGHDVRLLRAFAAQTTVLIERSLLYEEVEAGAVIQERSRLAREIHDGIAQHLAFLKMRVAWLQRSPGSFDVQQLRDIEGVLETALIEARHAISTLRAQPEGASTADAITEYSEEFGQVSGIEVKVRRTGVSPDVGPKVRVQLLRIVQESLNNVRKHAQATSVLIDLTGDDDGIEVCIEDNGRGFETGDTPEGHFGLEIMRERAESVGGTLSVESRPGRGTRVLMRTPADGAHRRVTRAMR